jgi:hypothetical protein
MHGLYTLVQQMIARQGEASSAMAASITLLASKLALALRQRQLGFSRQHNIQQMRLSVAANYGY